MELKEITFVLENCDSITIDGKYIGDFLVDEINTSIQRIAVNAIEQIDSANIVAIEIHKDANKERYPFGQTGWEDGKHMTFDRLVKGKDITSIKFELESYSKEDWLPYTRHYSYYVDWVGDSDYENNAQSSYISKDGHLYLVIAKDKVVSDFFNMNEIDDSEYMDFHFDMLDVGDVYGDPNRYKDNEEVQDD